MNYKEALEYIHSVVWQGSRPGLERITELMNKLGNPQDSLRFIHVGGTNGKGSTCSMLSSVLRKAGYNVGCFTSPYVKFFEERMCINGEPISHEELANTTETVKKAAETMNDLPTEFELITAIGIVYFKNHGCDIVVFEVGMGGRLDSTNVIKTPVLSVITGISLDHTKLLGNTVSEIAAEKAGIIKPGIPVIFGGESTEAEEVISSKAKEMRSEFYKTDHSLIKNEKYTAYGCEFDYSDVKDIKISLAGSYQPKNAALVTDAVKILRQNGFEISDEAFRSGMYNAQWHARFEIMKADAPTVIYDGGHNPEGVAACIDSIKKIFGNTKVVLLSGVMADKEYDTMIESLRQITEKAFTVIPNNPRALDSYKYAENFKAHGINAKAYDRMYDGIAAAYLYARKCGIPMLALGSLYMYEEFCKELDKTVKNYG